MSEVPNWGASRRKIINLERHYDCCHGSLKRLIGQVRQDKIKLLERELQAQQSTSRYRMEDVDSIRTSCDCEISELIAEKLKRYADGEFIKERIVTAAKLLPPDKVQLFQKLCLSGRTASDRKRNGRKY